MFKRFSMAAAIGLLLCAGPALAHDYALGPLKIGHPWSRATPDGAKVGGGYLKIENTGGQADRLVAVSAPFAARVEIHEMAVTDGVMTMRPLDDGLAVPAGGTVELKPGGFHIMFMELKEPLKQGERRKATLRFEKAGTVEVEFAVEAIGTKGSGHEHKGH